MHLYVCSQIATRQSIDESGVMKRVKELDVCLCDDGCTLMHFLLVTKAFLIHTEV